MGQDFQRQGQDRQIMGEEDKKTGLNMDWEVQQ
jgi:hypothetical protein